MCTGSPLRVDLTAERMRARLERRARGPPNRCQGREVAGGARTAAPNTRALKYSHARHCSRYKLKSHLFLTKFSVRVIVFESVPIGSLHRECRRLPFRVGGDDGHPTIQERDTWPELDKWLPDHWLTRYSP